MGQLNETGRSTKNCKPKTQLSTEDTTFDCISRREAIDALTGLEFCHYMEFGEYIGEDTREVRLIRAEKAQDALQKLSSAQPEWNNHTVACLLAELLDDACACNYSGIDEWLPEKCELLDSCPNPVGVACWEQFLKHKAERRTDEAD